MLTHDLINIGMKYIKMGVVISVVLLIVGAIFYFLVYRKLPKEKQKFKVKNIVWLFCMICYMITVLGATMLSRGSVNLGLEGRVIPLFDSYKEAWRSFNGLEWRNIILNYLMFVPLGVLLPMGTNKLRSVWKVYVAGFGFTLIIELMQLVLHVGIFEMDDILGNTIGTMFGYGIWICGAYLVGLINNCRKSKADVQNRERKSEENIDSSNSKRVALWKVLCAQLPLVLVVVAFAIIFAKYDNQTLGNIKFEPIVVRDKEKIKLGCETQLNNTNGKVVLPIYKANVLSVEEAIDKGKQLLEQLGYTCDEGSVDIYEETVYLRGIERFLISVDYAGGIYELTDFNTIYPEDENEVVQGVEGATEEEVRACVKSYGIDVPEAAEFTELSDGQYEFSVSMLKQSDKVINGRLLCEYYGDGKAAHISNNFIECMEYSYWDVLSEKQAYDKIANGEFVSFIQGLMDIVVKEVNVEYEIDTKGYYQPVYAFDVTVNGEQDRIYIPAVINKN